MANSNLPVGQQINVSQTGHPYPEPTTVTELTPTTWANRAVGSPAGTRQELDGVLYRSDGVGGWAPISSAKRLSTAAAARVFTSNPAAASAGFTLALQQPTTLPFYGVQLIYMNSGAAAYDITLAKIAPSPTDAADGTTLTWTGVTFAGASTGTVPAGSGAIQNNVPGMLASDIIPVTALARTDNPASDYLLHARTYMVGASSHHQVGGTTFADWEAKTGHQWGSRTGAGDLVTVISQLAPLRAGTFTCPSLVKFWHDSPVVAVAAVGDSLTRGQGSTSGFASAAYLACSVKSSSAKTYEYMNFGVSGQGHAASIATGNALLATTALPDVLVFFAWSPNDGAATQAVMDSAWFRTIDLIENCKQKGVIPIVCTSGPVNSLSAADNARRIAQNNRVLGLRNGITVADVASVLTDPTNTGRILPAYDSGDGIHYNDAGYTAASGVLSAALSGV